MARRPRPGGNGKRAGRRSGGRRRGPILWSLAKALAVAAIWTGFLLLCAVAWLAYDLPDVSRLNDIERRPSVTLLAEDGSIVASFGDLYGEPVRLSDLPPYLPQAVLATEDRRFYGHFGVDPIGVLRALYVNLREGEVIQGGSTITQQLAKNVFLTPDRTFRRKGQELLLALWLERNFTKDQILALYLNRVYLGAGTYGIDAASRRYFGKPAAQLTAYESAMLIGLLKAPSRFNPLSDPDIAHARARLVLRNMVAAGYLDEAAAARVAEGDAGETRPVLARPSGQYFADWVLDQVSSYIGYSDRDLVVVTTIDRTLQRLAEARLAALMAEEGPKRKASQAALVAMTIDGKVRAMVGGRDYAESQFNRATQALRQPGSAFKAFVFLAGFERGLRPDSRFVDRPFAVGSWSPMNYEGKYFGEVTLREAFARSLNSVAVQVSERIGRQRVAEAARRLGITTEIGPGPSVALGASEVTLLELTAAYGVFGNNGYGVWPSGIEEIRDTAGEVLYRREGSGPARVVGSAQLGQIIDVMTAVVEWGTGRAAKLDRPVAGKTGTSTDFRDAWFVGFTAELVTGVWVGNDDGAPMDKVSGGSLPTRLWHDFMAAALEGQPPRPLMASGPAVAAVAPPPAAEEQEDGLFEQLIKRIIEGDSNGGSAPSGEPSLPVKRERK